MTNVKLYLTITMAKTASNLFRIINIIKCDERLKKGSIAILCLTLLANTNFVNVTETYKLNIPLLNGQRNTKTFVINVFNCRLFRSILVYTMSLSTKLSLCIHCLSPIDMTYS
jgi:hypothetical protein